MRGLAKREKMDAKGGYPMEAFDLDMENLMDEILAKDERDAKMKFRTKQEAEAYRRSGPLPEKHRVVKSFYFDMKEWKNKECWTVVFDA